MNQNNSNSIDILQKIKKLNDKTPQYWQSLSRAVINAPCNAVFTIDLKGIIFLANDNAQKHLGILEGLPVKNIVPQLEGPIFEALADCKQGIEISVKIGDKDYFARINSIVSEGNRLGVICMLEESAELEKIAYKMQFFREKAFELDTIINSSSDALFICDAKANVTRINPASERIHQIKAEQIVGKNMADLIKQGFIERSAALEVTRCKNKVSLLQTKNGRKLISTGTPVFDDKGNLIKVVVSEQDITKLDTLQRKLEKQQAKKNQIQDHLHEIQQTELEPNKIIVQSASVVKTLEQALKVSSANSSVLITGESGVGKGLVAKLIHQNSSRSNKPFIRINCGAIPESLIESELFGYEYGAFTGAQSKGKPGHLELAHSGTLFLDEIAELPLPAQVKLLRFLENGSLTRLGSSRTITVDARILAATHQNLKRMASKGEFRKDLYYRLRVIPLTVPPLRERKACILPLLRYFIDYFSKINKTKKRLSQKAIGSLMTYSYPGNVRELINICERAVVMSETEIIDLQDLPNDIVCGISNKFGQSTQWPAKMCLKQILERVERDVLMQTIEKYGNQSSAAAALGVSQPTIARRLKKYNIKE